MKGVLYGFEIKTLTLDARKSLASLSGYLGSASAKLSTIKTKLEFWAILQKIYALKMDPKFDDSTSLNVACMVLSSMSKQERRRRVKNFKTGTAVSEKKRIMAKLNKKNDEFYAKPSPEKHPSKAQKEEFYKTWDWQKLRVRTFEKYGHRCLCCGATRDSTDMLGRPVQLVVDHVKPLHTHWSKRLDAENTQILCFDCNMGKGVDETDHRPK